MKLYIFIKQNYFILTIIQYSWGLRGDNSWQGQDKISSSKKLVGTHLEFNIFLISRRTKCTKCLIKVFKICFPRNNTKT